MDRISDFFKSQYDYIYFFYGLSFLFLALICFSIDREKSRKLPWFLLGFFGLIHGLNEWIDLSALTYGQNIIFSFLHPFMLGLSYIFLLEFALRGHYRLTKKILVRRWVYFALLLLVFLASESGDNGLAVGIRYFLGFPASILCAITVFRAARIERKEKMSLYTLGITFVFYSLFTGLIVPRADFLAASTLNFDSFYRAFKIPVQLIRGILALCIAMSVWFYSSVLSDITYNPRTIRMSLKLTKWGIIFTIIILIGMGWVFTNFLDYYASIQIIKNTKGKANSPLNYLIKELTALEKTAATLAGSSVVRNALLSQKGLEKVEPLFDNFIRRYNMRGCSLLGLKGAIIILVGEAGPEKEPQEPFIREAYFKDALTGNTGFSLSLGSKYNERVYYVSYPVRDSQGAVAGVILLTKVISVKPVLQYRIFSIVITFFVCILAITLFIMIRKREGLIEFIDHANTQLREIDRMKTDFISIVSHELRTPLTSINNAATILMKNKFNKEKADPREKELIDIIIKNTQRQTRMVADLLDISKIEAKVMPVRIEKVDIPALVDDVAASFQPFAGEKRISLGVSGNAPMEMVNADPEHTRRVIVNLLSNAIKFTPNGGRVNININDSFWEVIISVSDTGSGIPKEGIQKLFTKFYRVADASGHQPGGTGLGLMIAKGLVEAQGGRIWLESEVGKGSVFYFALPKTGKLTDKGHKDIKAPDTKTEDSA